MNRHVVPSLVASIVATAVVLAVNGYTKERPRIIVSQASGELTKTKATRLADVHLTFEVKVGEEEKLYGSVTASDIQRKLEELGIKVDKRKVDLPEPIRELGEFKVGIKIHPEVRPEVRVTVVKE